MANSTKKEIGVTYRLALCALKMGKSDKLQEYVAELSKFFEKSDPTFSANEKEIARIKPEYDKLCERVQESLRKTDSSKVAENYVEFHKKIEFKESDKKGRFMISLDEINEGDVIFEEKAFAFVPLSLDGFYFDCANCGKTNVVPYP